LAIQNAGSLDREKVRSALAALDVTTFYGPIRFNDKGLNVSKPMVTIQIQHGKVVTVWPANVAAAKAIYPTPVWTARK
jgi:branched-chain amino acid transport system substrate-binding protein